nr:EOG090X0FHR [Leptodora kindtii]
MDGAGAYGAGKAGGSFNPVEFVQRPQVILRLLNILFSVIVFGSINAQGWHYKEKETCLYNGDANACNYGVGIGVIAFLAASLLVAGEYFLPQMSSVKTRRHFVLGDLGFSAFWAFLYAVGFIYLASQWNKTADIPEAIASGNNLRAAIAFSFFSVFTWAGSAYFAFQRNAQGADSAFATAYETGAGAPGVATSPGTVGGYASFPAMADSGYQAPPFSSAPRVGSIGDYQPPTY